MPPRAAGTPRSALDSTEPSVAPVRETPRKRLLCESESTRAVLAPSLAAPRSSSPRLLMLQTLAPELASRETIWSPSEKITKGPAMIGADLGCPAYVQCDFPSNEDATSPASLTPTASRAFATRGSACKRCSTCAIEAPESFCQSGSSAELGELTLPAPHATSHVAIGTKTESDRRRLMVRCS